MGKLCLSLLLVKEMGRKPGQKLPFPSLIYGVLAAEKELKFDYEFLTKNKPLVIHRLMEKAKSEGGEIYFS